MDRIDNFRGLTRDLTRAVGLLSSGLTHSNLPLTDARVFYEINRKPWTGRALAEYLGLDEGYVSRIVSRLEQNGWVMRAVSKTDRRRRELIPTDEGKAKLPEMVGWIRARARDVLGDVPGLNARHTDEAIGRLRHHLAPEEVAEAPVIFRDLAPGETGWITNRFAEFARLTYDMDQSLEALVGQIMVDYLFGHDPSRDRVWIAERAGLKLGTIMCVHGDDPEVAHLRMFFVDPLARGQSVGAELIERCIQFARDAGYKKMTLWTMSLLLPAIKLYERAGFVCVAKKVETNFGQTVENQTWELDL